MPLRLMQNKRHPPTTSTSRANKSGGLRVYYSGIALMGVGKSAVDAVSRGNGEALDGISSRLPIYQHQANRERQSW